MKPGSRFYLIRYADHTLDVVAGTPEGIKKVQTLSGVNSVMCMGDEILMALNRDPLVDVLYDKKEDEKEDK